jgi:LysM repeat protein
MANIDLTKKINIAGHDVPMWAIVGGGAGVVAVFALVTKGQTPVPTPAGTTGTDTTPPPPTPITPVPSPDYSSQFASLSAQLTGMIAGNSKNIADFEKQVQDQLAAQQAAFQNSNQHSYNDQAAQYAADHAVFSYQAPQPISAPAPQSPKPTPPPPAAPAPAKSTTPANVSGSVYTVQSGDTLSKIAKQSGLSLSTLLYYNPQFQANPNLIRPGQKVNLFNAAQYQSNPQSGGEY